MNLASALAYSAAALLLGHMLGWSMNLFRVRGIQVAVHFSFLLLLAINGFVAGVEGGLSDVAWQTALLLAFFSCVVLHELGHSFTAMHYGIGVRRILLLPIGGMAEFDEIPREPRRELLITLAGPAVNFALAALLWLVLPRTVSANAEVITLTDFGHNLMLLNLGMGCFNLLPAFPMDGGRIVRAALATRVSYLRATFWAATVGKALCVIGMVVGFRYEPMLTVLFAFILLMGELEYRAVRRREIEDEELRATLDRLYALPPRMDEPPVLLRRGAD